MERTQIGHSKVKQITAHNCRFCGASLTYTLVDLGMSPLCNKILRPDQLNEMEPFFPLHVLVCDNCFLVQLQEYVSPQDIFSDYSYFSSYSDSWLQHAKRYTETIIDRLGLTPHSQIIEIASNDGYLLQYFIQHGFQVLGVEPAANVAEVAIQKGIPTLVRFFGKRTAQDLLDKDNWADLIVGNNVLAHVPDVNDLVAGMKILLNERGVITMEFPYLIQLMQQNQFDTIYHEHFSYFSLITVEKIFAAHDLRLFDVEELLTHGGSLRIYACHSENTAEPISERLQNLRRHEIAAGFTNIEHYFAFGEKVKSTKRTLLQFLINAKNTGKTVVGYGAPGKGNTLLNYCGIRTDFLEYTVDRSPHKQQHFLPGTHIPIYHPDRIKETQPDYVLILPWNLKDEIMEQLSYIRHWGGQFVLPIPQVEIHP